MMMSQCALLALSLLMASSMAQHAKIPKGRGLFQPNTVTVYVEQKNLVTEINPSSCVVVEPSLPPCRHVRQVRIEPTATQLIMQTEAPQLFPQVAQRRQMHPEAAQARFFWLSGSQPTPPIQEAKEKVGVVEEPPKKRPWDGWFFSDVTHTRAIVHNVTKRIEDPNTVVKFSVRGCEPSRLPFDLPKCKEAAEPNKPNEEPDTASVSREIHYVSLQ